MSNKRDVVVLSAVRSAIGVFNGSLSDIDVRLEASLGDRRGRAPMRLDRERVVR